MSRCLMPGCREPAKPKGDYCKDAHRAAAHKLRKRLGGMLPRERRRARDAAAKRAARAHRVIPSDVRLSYEKTIGVLAGHFEGQGMLPEVALARAESVLAVALPVSKRPVAP